MLTYETILDIPIDNDDEDDDAAFELTDLFL